MKLLITVVGIILTLEIISLAEKLDDLSKLERMQKAIKEEKERNGYASLQTVERYNHFLENNPHLLNRFKRISLNYVNTHQF